MVRICEETEEKIDVGLLRTIDFIRAFVEDTDKLSALPDGSLNIIRKQLNLVYDELTDWKK